MKPLRILFTGSRDWWDTYAVERALLDTIASVAPGRVTYELADLDMLFGSRHARGRSTYNLQGTTAVLGGARGLDTIADSFARELDLRRELHHADWERWGRAAGHRRNAEMVKAGADVCLAFPIGESRGTRGCIRLAEKAGIPVIVHEGTPK